MGVRGYGGGGRGRVYTYRYAFTTRMTCIKMGSDESHFNVSLIVRDKVTRPRPQTTTFEEKGEPKRYRTEVLPLTSLTARPDRHWYYPIRIYIARFLNCFIHSFFFSTCIGKLDGMIPVCPGLMCSFNKVNSEGTNSSKICVRCLCTCMFCFMFA